MTRREQGAKRKRREKNELLKFGGQARRHHLIILLSCMKRHRFPKDRFCIVAEMSLILVPSKAPSSKHIIQGGVPRVSHQNLVAGEAIPYLALSETCLVAVQCNLLLLLCDSESINWSTMHFLARFGGIDAPSYSNHTKPGDEASPVLEWRSE